MENENLEVQNNVVDIEATDLGNIEEDIQGLDYVEEEEK